MAVKWFRALTISGKPAGFAFECDTCRLLIPYDAPEVVKHCNTTSHAPFNAAGLPFRRLRKPGGNDMPANALLVFDATPDDDHEKEPQTWV